MHRLAPLVTATVATLLIVLTAYMGAYYALTRTAYTLPCSGKVMRSYRTRWQARLFVPASKVEEIVCRRAVYCYAPESPDYWH